MKKNIQHLLGIQKLSVVFFLLSSRSEHPQVHLEGLEQVALSPCFSFIDYLHRLHAESLHQKSGDGLHRSRKALCVIEARRVRVFAEPLEGVLLGNRLTYA